MVSGWNDMSGNAGAIDSNAYSAANSAENIRKDIMQEIKDAVSNSVNDKTGNDLSVGISLPGCNGNVDIASGPGALLLDDCLQKLSTIQQTSAQVLSSKNNTAKQIVSKLG